MVTCSILLFSVTMSPGGLREWPECLLVLNPLRKTQTRYHHRLLDLVLTRRLTLVFSDPQIIGVRDTLFIEDTVIKVL